MVFEALVMYIHYYLNLIWMGRLRDWMKKGIGGGWMIPLQHNQHQGGTLEECCRSSYKSCSYLSN